MLRADENEMGTFHKGKDTVNSNRDLKMEIPKHVQMGRTGAACPTSHFAQPHLPEGDLGCEESFK